MGSAPRTSEASAPGGRQAWRPLPRVASVAESWYHPGRLAATSQRFGSRVGLSQVARWRLELASVEHTDDWSVRPPANAQHWRRQHDAQLEATPADQPVEAGFSRRSTREVVPQVRRGLPRMMVARGAAVPGSIAASLRPVTIDPKLIDRTRRTAVAARAAAATSQSVQAPHSAQAQSVQVPPRPSRREAKRSMEAFRRMLVGAGKLPPREGDGTGPMPAQPTDASLPPIAVPAGRTRDDSGRDDAGYDDAGHDEPDYDDPWADEPLPDRPRRTPEAGPGPGGRAGIDSRPGPDMRRSADVAAMTARRAPGPARPDPGRADPAGALERAAMQPSSPGAATSPLPAGGERVAGPRTEQSAIRSRALSAIGLLDSASTIGGGAPPVPAIARPDREQSGVKDRTQRWPADTPAHAVAPAAPTADPGGDETTSTVRESAVRPPVALTDSATPRQAAPREVIEGAGPILARSMQAPEQHAPRQQAATTQAATTQAATTQAPTSAAPARQVQAAARRTMLAMLAAHERPDTPALGLVPHEPVSPGGIGAAAVGARGPQTDRQLLDVPPAAPAPTAVVQVGEVAVPAESAEVARGEVARGEVAARRATDRRALAEAAPLQAARGPGRAQGDERRVVPAATTAPPSPPGGGGAAEAFSAVMRAEPPVAPRPLPATLRPLAAAIVGHTAVEMRTDHAARRALAAAGKRAATVGNVIHLQRTPELVADRALIAHELTHVAHPSAEPRFFDDDRPSVEEARAEEIARLVQRAPLPALAPSAPARLPERPAPAAARTSTIDQTLDAAELAARLAGAETMAPAPAPARPAPAGSVDTRQAMRSVAPAAVVRRSPALDATPDATPESTGGPSTPAVASHSAPAAAITRAATASVVERAHAEPVLPAPIRRAVTDAPSDGGLSGNGGNGVQSVSGSDPFTAQLADLRTASGTVDFVDWMMRQIEDRLLAELQRRGGRFRGEF